MSKTPKGAEKAIVDDIGVPYICIDNIIFVILRHDDYQLLGLLFPQ